MTSKSDGSALCQRCGLCCDGTLHPNAQINAGDAHAVRALGLATEVVDGRDVFRLPCPLFRACVCSVYEARPQTCRTYRCDVLTRYENGTLTFEESEQHVQRALALRQDVLDALPPGEAPDDIWRAFGRAWDSGHGPAGSAESRQVNAGWLMRLGKLRRYLRRHFEAPR